jgi:hypothetical protein
MRVGMRREERRGREMYEGGNEREGEWQGHGGRQ